MLRLEVLSQNLDDVEALPVEDLAASLLDYLRRITPHDAHLGRLCAADGSPIMVNTYGVASREFDNRIKSPELQRRLSQLRAKVVWPLAEAGTSWSVTGS